MQSPATAPPAPPGAPSAPQVQGVAVPSTQGGPAEQLVAPLTATDVATLRHRRTELSNQLVSATGRRDELAGDLRTAIGADREGITARIVQLDQRILRIEADIAANGRLLAAAPASAFETGASSGADGAFLPSVREVTVFGGMIVFVAFSLALARQLWRRVPGGATAPERDSRERLERIEQAVEAIAIEVERVSESQRFLTRTMAGAAPAALGAGAAPMEPIPVGEAERVPLRGQVR